MYLKMLTMQYINVLLVRIADHNNIRHLIIIQYHKSDIVFKYIYYITASRLLIILDKMAICPKIKGITLFGSPSRVDQRAYVAVNITYINIVFFSQHRVQYLCFAP